MKSRRPVNSKGLLASFMLVRAVYLHILVSIAIIWVASVTSCNSREGTLVSKIENTNAASPSPSRTNRPVTVTDGRDLSLYDFGGRQGCGIVLKTEIPKCEASMKIARDFIWSHWTDRRRGYVIVKMASVDAQSDAHIFIEPDEVGAWHIAWNWQRIFGFAAGRDVSGDIDAMPDIRSVERKVASDTDYRYLPGTPYLSFIGGDGNEVSYF